MSVDKEYFKDEYGRTIILRGVNLGGDCKVPYPDGGTYVPTDFSDHRAVNFINRPFSLDKVDEHFTRLKSWGFNCLRLLTTWEAIEHKGPNEFDTEYLDYYAKLCKRADDHGLYVVVDFHQDVWSRMSGGDGAPCWLFEKIGIDYTKIRTTNAALVMQYEYDYTGPTPWQEHKYPPMCWLQNKFYPAGCIMYTLFFGGRYFAQHRSIDGVNIQDYMQGHFLRCQQEIAKRIKDCTHVIGFDTLNEPSPGWIGTPLDKPINKTIHKLATKTNIIWRPIDGLYSMSGHTVKLPIKGILRTYGVKLINPDKESLWLPGHTDPFQDEGAWKMKPDGTYDILRNDFFQRAQGKLIDFKHDCLSPFYYKVAENIRAINSDWILFLEKDPYDLFHEYPQNIPPNSVNATHWYHSYMLKTKQYKSYRAWYKYQLNMIKKKSKNMNDGCPTLLGEFGIPFNLYFGLAYKKYKQGDHSSSIWSKHTQALDKMYDTLDALLLHSTQWNYTASNSNNPVIGDGWNQEDFSIYSPDQRDDPKDINSGGRAIQGFVRPFPHAIQGKPLKIRFNQKTGRFLFRYLASPSIQHPTEIYVPNIQYPKGYEIEAKDVDIQKDEQNQRVFLISNSSGVILVNIKRK